jgi:hypothetical protein|tara:strand:+ start:2646 stop:2996 length:351 start_codon:yes stop_codon:yes gene_type:complete
MSGEELSDEPISEDEIDVVSVEDVLVEWDGEEFLGLSYVCKATDGRFETHDRSDLMDSGPIQRLVLAYERKHPPPWDSRCIWCEGEGCEECECSECDRKCRMISGVNFGCPAHPVI